MKKKEPDVKERDWKKEAEAFEILDELERKLNKTGICIYLDTKNNVRLCSKKERIAEKELWKNKYAKKLRVIDEEIIREFLRVERVCADKGVYMPAGYVTYKCAFESDFRNGNYELDNVGKLSVNVPYESTDWGDGIKLTITPEVTKAEAIKTLKAIIRDMEVNDNFDRLKKQIKKMDVENNKPTKRDLKEAQLLEKGYTLLDLKKHFKKRDDYSAPKLPPIKMQSFHSCRSSNAG